MMNKTSKLWFKHEMVAITDQFTTQNTVKQGTTFGPIICCAETDRVNKINERVSAMYGPELEIDMPVFMDDKWQYGKNWNNWRKYKPVKEYC